MMSSFVIVFVSAGTEPDSLFDPLDRFVDATRIGDFKHDGDLRLIHLEHMVKISRLDHFDRGKRGFHRFFLHQSDNHWSKRSIQGSRSSRQSISMQSKTAAPKQRTKVIAAPCAA